MNVHRIKIRNSLSKHEEGPEKSSLTEKEIRCTRETEYIEIGFPGRVPHRVIITYSSRNSTVRFNHEIRFSK